MIAGDVEKIGGLGAVLLVAVGVLWVVLRAADQDKGDGVQWMAGYPLAYFPVAALTSSGPLATLTHIQHRLIRLYGGLPLESDLALWLNPFLTELRAIMDQAYQVALITRLYGQQEVLEQLANEVSLLEKQVAEQVTLRLVSRPSSDTFTALDEQLGVLRLCVEHLSLSGPAIEQT
jgi:hypothetical protein